MPRLALEGFRIVECGDMVAASYAAKLMADMGAEVIKIEDPAGGDIARRDHRRAGHGIHLLRLRFQCHREGERRQLAIGCHESGVSAG